MSNIGWPPTPGYDSDVTKKIFFRKNFVLLECLRVVLAKTTSKGSVSNEEGKTSGDQSAWSAYDHPVVSRRSKTSVASNMPSGM